MNRAASAIIIGPPIRNPCSAATRRAGERHQEAAQAFRSRTGFGLDSRLGGMAIFRLPDLRPDLKFDLGSGLGKHHASSIDVRSNETLRTCGCAWLWPKNRDRFGGRLWIRCRGRQARRQQIGDLELVRLRKRIPGKANAQHRRIENAFLGGGDRRSDLGGEQAAKS